MHKRCSTAGEYTSFSLDPRLAETTWVLSDWPLCRILLKNHADYPWLILVPRKLNLKEITALSLAESMQLMREVRGVSQVVQDYFKPDKLNLGTLGNVVSQFHFHVVARFESDPLWPESIWQSRLVDRAYDNPEPLVHELSRLLIWDEELRLE
jgi:diadenosine tetraphosphate (Ap4A) HIT family hydrolase